MEVDAKDYVHKAEVALLETKLQSKEAALAAALQSKEAVIEGRDGVMRRVQSEQGRDDGPAAAGAA
jgi:hypothetical protein